MRVLHLTRDYPPRNHGGLSSAVSGWVQAHRGVGGEDAVISFDAYRPRQGTPPNVRESGASPATLRVEGAVDPEAVLPFARTQRPDVLHLHDPLLVQHAEALRAALSAPLVVSVHVLHHQLAELRGLPEPTASARAEARALRIADVLTAPSPGALQRLRDDHGTLRAPTHVLPLAITPAEPNPPVERRAPAVVLFAGRFADVKGVTDFLEAAALAAERLPNVRFELAGGLPASPRSERRFAAKYLDAPPAQLAGRLRWLGYCDAPALDAAYRRAHVLVAPSWSETFGQCAFEALSRGTPLITSAVGAYADYLEHGRECLQVPARDTEALAEAMVQLLRDEPLRCSLAARGPLTSASFAPACIGATLHDLYRGLASTTQSSG